MLLGDGLSSQYVDEVGVRTMGHTHNRACNGCCHGNTWGLIWSVFDAPAAFAAGNLDVRHKGGEGDEREERAEMHPTTRFRYLRRVWRYRPSSSCKAVDSVMTPLAAEELVGSLGIGIIALSRLVRWAGPWAFALFRSGRSLWLRTVVVSEWWKPLIDGAYVCPSTGNPPGIVGYLCCANNHLRILHHALNEIYATHATRTWLLPMRHRLFGYEFRPATTGVLIHF
ncbi:hypothetical protein BD779DRAFT_317776 [Infundibulicybe gibba]|nr:hypothetical protein BD779DRAFT_317776 [Infundibulicybe gibba]